MMRVEVRGIALRFHERLPAAARHPLKYQTRGAVP